MILHNLKPMISSIISSVIGDDDSIKRNFTQLTAALGTYWEFADTVEFQSGDTFKMLALMPSVATSGTEYLTDGAGVAERAYIFLKSTGQIEYNNAAIGELKVDSVVVANNGNYPVDGKLHELEITLNNPCDLRFLGIRFNKVTPFTGIIASPVSTISGQAQTFTLGNGVGDDTEYNAENTFGAELVASPTQTVNISSNFASATLTDSSPIVIGSLYEYQYKLLSTSNGGVCRLRSLQGTGGSYANVGETLSGLGTADGTGIILQGSVAGDYTLSLVSVKEVLGNAITRVNVPDASIEQFTFVDDSWWSDNYMQDPIDMTSSQWIATGSPIRFVNGFTATSTGVEGLNYSTNKVGNLRLTYDITADDSYWTIKDTATRQGAAPTILNGGSGSSVGELDYVSSTGGLYVRHTTTTNSNVTINKLELNKVLEVAS